jgi:FkbM family methyltransferase
MQQVKEQELKDVLEFLQSNTCVKRLLCATSEGTFLVSVNDLVVGGDLALYATWELPETEFTKSLLRTGDCVIDAGANFGWYTVVCARAVGAAGRVIAFEPEPVNFDLLRENVRANNVEDQVSLFSLALLDSEKTVSLALSARNLGDHQICFERDDLRDVVSVQARILDRVLEEDQQLLRSLETVRLFKIDCQGSEISILRGAGKTLAKVDVLLVEFWPDGWQERGFNVDEFYAIVTSNFAEFSRIGDPLFPEINFQPVSLLRQDMLKPLKNYTNYAFVKAGALASDRTH